MKLLLQVVFILLAITFIGLIYCLRFAPPENYLSVELRPALIKSTFVRTIFQLKQVGDARYQFAAGQSALPVQVWYPSDISLNPELSHWLTDMVSLTINRPVEVTTHLFPSTANGPLSDTDIEVLLKTQVKPSAGELSVVYLPQSASALTNAGQAVSSNTMLMFYETINALSERPAIRDMVEQSTIMHEWGHLLSLEHINQEACIMNERVEVFGNRLYQGSNIPTVYCPEELYQLRQLAQ